MNTRAVLGTIGLVLCGCAFCGPAGAQDLPPCAWPSVVAVLVNGEVNGTISAFTPATIDFYLMNAEVANLGGFEMAWSCDADPGTMLQLSLDLPPSSLNIGDAHNLIVGIGAPYPYVSPGVRLARFTCICVADLPCAKIHLAPAQPASLPGQMAYNDFNNPTHIIAMEPISDDFESPVGSINCSGLDLVSVCGVTPEGGLDLEVDIAVTAGVRSDAGNLAATSEAASDDFDSDYDVPEPGPPPDGEFLIASFWHPDWPLGPRFRVDVRTSLASSQDARTWPLRIENGQTGGDQVALTFAPDFGADAGIPLRLSDPASGEVTNLFPALAYNYTQAGGGTRDFEIIVGGATPLEPTNRLVAGGWSLIGLPLRPQDSGTLGGEILDDAHAPAYLYSYSGGAIGSYVTEGANSPATLGKGYWIASLDTFTWTMAGTPAVTTVELPQTEGFNLVGDPMWFAGDLAGVQVRHGGIVMSYDEAVAADLVAPVVWSYDPIEETYVTGTALAPWHGYWFRVYPAAANDLTLLFDWVVYGWPPQPLDHWRDQVPGTSWRRDLTLELPGGRTSTVTVGAHPEATAGMDVRFDLPVPPAAPAASTAALRSLRSQWDPALGRSFGQDIVGTEMAPLFWDLEIDAPGAQTVTLRWNPEGWPADTPLELYRTDEDRIVVPDVSGASEVVLNVGTTPVHLHLRSAAAASAGDAAEPSFDLTAAPNPGNPGLTLRLALARDADVAVHIFDLRGQTVRTFALGSLPAGQHAVTWQGRDDGGRALPSGTYFATVVADGVRVGPVARLMLVR